MTDRFTQACLTFLCNHSEMALLEEAFDASADLMMGSDAGNPSPEFLAAFPPNESEDPWRGFRTIFDNPASPTFGAQLEGGTMANDMTRSRAIILGHGVDAEAITKLIHRCCRRTLSEGPVGFAGARCSRLRIGEFDGGWYALFTDRAESKYALASLDEAIRDLID